VANFSQLQPGDKVKATITEAATIFLVKNGPPPSAGPGVAVSGLAGGGQLASVVLDTMDAQAKVNKVDPSYRLLTVEYANGSTKDFKVPLPANLENVRPGDEAVVRTTEPLVIRIEPGDSCSAAMTQSLPSDLGLCDRPAEGGGRPKAPEDGKHKPKANRERLEK